jgi:hypothetical protein
MARPKAIVVETPQEFFFIIENETQPMYPYDKTDFVDGIRGYYNMVFRMFRKKYDFVAEMTQVSSPEILLNDLSKVEDIFNPRIGDHETGELFRKDIDWIDKKTSEALETLELLNNRKTNEMKKSTVNTVASIDANAVVTPTTKSVTTKNKKKVETKTVKAPAPPTVVVEEVVKPKATRKSRAKKVTPIEKPKVVQVPPAPIGTEQVEPEVQTQEQVFLTEEQLKEQIAIMNAMLANAPGATKPADKTQPPKVEAPKEQVHKAEVVVPMTRRMRRGGAQATEIGIKVVSTTWIVAWNMASDACALMAVGGAWAEAAAIKPLGLHPDQTRAELKDAALMRSNRIIAPVYAVPALLFSQIQKAGSNIAIQTSEFKKQVNASLDAQLKPSI